jgi:NADH:ubiquinone oxidoreductase subunit F (NADH-binding)
MRLKEAVSASRLLPSAAGDGAQDLGSHLRRFGPLAIKVGDPSGTPGLLAEIERSGLTGRGGAGFPSSRKIRLVQSAGDHPVLAVNAMEGEPASGKDRLLLKVAPHLVLDGAELVGRAIKAAKILLCLPEDRHLLAASLTRALQERAAAGFISTPIEVVRLSGRYVAGEESALVAAAAGDAGVPAFRIDKSIPLRIGRRSALVHNVETLGHVALIGRYGASWFRELGPQDAPGTCLVTISGAVERPGVVEVEIGAPIRAIVATCVPTRPIQAVLTGGYGGSWLSDDELGVAYSPRELQPLGASMGAGVLVALPADSCGIRETARIARFMAAESAGQCGPCLFGLPAIAGDLEAIASGVADHLTVERLLRRCAAVEGRGACRHPDGVARLVRSALRVFSSDLASHLRGGCCAGHAKPTVLLLPPELGGLTDGR